MSSALLIAIVGAESTGKTELARALAWRIEKHTGLACTAVPEHLRAWCDREGRTPQRNEQAAIAAAQSAAIDTAASEHEVVVCDTTALMTAVYSRMVFDDHSLVGAAVDWQGRCAITLLTALDLPWAADGLQRDGPHVREPVDRLLRDVLIGQKLPWALVGGAGAARVDSALDAVAPLLRAKPAPRRGLFSRLAERNAEAAARPWTCENCDDPGCEHLTRQRRPVG